MFKYKFNNTYKHKMDTPLITSIPSLFEKYKNKGISGLANIGNTCYLNSCMQILSHTYELNEFLETGEYKKRLNRVADSVVLLEWDKLREMLWNSNCIVAPYGFVKTIQKIAVIKKRDIFTGHSQNDTPEFLLFIIDCFQNALSREVDMHINGVSENDTDKMAIACYNMMKNMYKKEYSEILKIFYGIHVSEIISCVNKEQLSVTPEPFSILSLSIPNKSNPSLYDCFDLYCEHEVLTGDNAWFNSTKNEKEAIVHRAISFWSLPDIMIIDLKRWHGHTQKNQILVNIPLVNADFSKYVKGYNSATYVYDLFGICNHYGGASGGHYTAYIKNANGKWYDYNDTNINEINEERVITTNSYCLFYRKKNKNI